MKASLIYITAGGVDEARAIARELVTSRLAACANIIDNVNSLYWWNGEVQDDREAIIILKTREALISRLVERVKSMHSYECPCIVSLPIAEGNPAFLEWIGTETRQEGGPVPLSPACDAA